MDNYAPGSWIPATCEDGRVRKVQITRTADTYYSVPARVTVKGRTVTGFVTILRTTDDARRIYAFTATGKNAHLVAPPPRFIVTVDTAFAGYRADPLDGWPTVQEARTDAERIARNVAMQYKLGQVTDNGYYWRLVDRKGAYFGRVVYDRVGWEKKCAQDQEEKRQARGG